MRYFAVFAAILAASPAFAAEPKVWTEAPVPRTSVQDVVAPADRAGRSVGPENDSPFSAIPNGTAATGNQTSSNSSSRGVSTPSVSR